MKKLIRNCLLLCFMLILAGCNFQTVEQYEQMEKQQQSVEQQTPVEKEQENPIQIAEQPQEKTSETSKENKAQQALPAITTEAPEKQAQPKEHAPLKQQEQEPKKEATVKKAEVTSKPSQQKQEVVKEKNVQQEPKKRFVTITIKAETLLKNWDLLDASLQSEAYVPKNGVILSRTKYELLSEKDSVWDVLQRATREHKIQLEYQGTNENMYNSVYIEGINHLYEFSAGPLSGWMYAVNGVYPNYGCSQYVLKDGDSIVWNYTVDLGRDLGQSVSGS